MLWLVAVAFFVGLLVGIPLVALAKFLARVESRTYKED